MKSILILRFKRSDKIGFYVLIRRGHVKDPTQNIIHRHLKTEHCNAIWTFVSVRRMNQLEFMVSKALMMDTTRWWLEEEQLELKCSCKFYSNEIIQNIVFLFVYSFYYIFNCYKLFLF